MTTTRRTIEGEVGLNAAPAQAELYLVEVAAYQLRAQTQSDLITGVYSFVDETGLIMGPDEVFWVFCDFGNDVRPEAHGPIAPDVLVIEGQPQRLWTISDDVTSALWLDASDADTLTIATGVSVWGDKSGNSRDATQSTGSRQPTVTTLNGIAAISFTGKYMQLPQLPSGNYSYFFVCKSETGTQISLAGKASDSFIPLASSSSTNNSEVLRINGAANPSDAYIVMNGSRILTPTRTTLYPLLQSNGIFAALDVPAMSANWEIGRGAASLSWYFGGPIGEIVVTSDDVQLNVRKKLEGFLAHKWALASVLSVGHPYKVNEPLLYEYSDLVYQSNPVSYWKLDEASGSAAEDFIGVNAGTFSGTQYTRGIAPAGGITGLGTSFQSGGITLNDPSLLPLGGTSGFAIEFLIWLEIGVTSQNGYIFGRGNTGDVVFHYGGENVVSFFKNTGTGTTVSATQLAATIPRDDKWHHVILGWNPSVSKYQIYLDGELVKEHTVATPATLSSTAARIGRSSGDANPFVGGLDEIAVYDGFPAEADIVARADYALQA